MTEKLPSADKLVKNYETLISTALNEIPSDYFKVPIIHEGNPEIEDNIRERVFCYEFYSCLRQLIKESDLDLAKEIIFIHGELPKQKYRSLPDIIPDFLIHKPYRKQSEKDHLNLVSIEVKGNLKEHGIFKDFKSLSLMTKNGYCLGIFILFSKSYQELKDHWNNTKAKMKPCDFNLYMDLYAQEHTKIKILVKESSESQLMEKTLGEFLKDVDDAIKSKAVSSQSKPLKAIEPTNPTADRKSLAVRVSRTIGNRQSAFESRQQKLAKYKKQKGIVDEAVEDKD